MWAIRHVATAKGVQMTWSPWASTTASLVWGAALSLPRAGYPPRYLHVLIRNPLLTRMMNSVEAVMDVAALAAEGFNEKERWMINEAAIKGPEHDEILISRCDYQDLIVLIVPGVASLQSWRIGSIHCSPGTLLPLLLRHRCRLLSRTSTRGSCLRSKLFST